MKTTKTKILSLIFLLIVLVGGIVGQKKQIEKNSLSYKTFCYVNPSSVQENFYIVMKDSFQGRMYGPTDLVDDVREGYLCGYFLTDMKHIRYRKDSIYFTLNISGQDVFDEPVSLIYRNSKDALLAGNKYWTDGSSSYLFGYGKQVKKEMAGKIAGDSISFSVPWIDLDPTKAKMTFFRVNFSKRYFD